MRQVIVITGSISEGFTFHGPFNNGPDAVDWADLNFNGEEWWTAPLNSIETEE